MLMSLIKAKRKALFSSLNLAKGIAVIASVARINANQMTYSDLSGYPIKPAMESEKIQNIKKKKDELDRREIMEVL
jgi:hypothetical protein